ncbi:hypothetical protein QYE76_067264 [Lolium multiflorum]|uniref:Integrase zinc-binding domain-containing protein n=1 Tax=Lolium multiflorum TaxID=4521 RepID=A0AAD8WCT9_LOLMU|nr:hypothetical protein QYE76_067264 [Lolium multiflorum]
MGRSPRAHGPLQPEVPLDQRLSTVPQHQWISKLFGFDFTVEYRPGRLNTVADALSRRDTTTPDAPTVGRPYASTPGPLSPSSTRFAGYRHGADAQQLRQQLDAASWTTHGASSTVFSSTGAACSFPTTMTSATRCCSWRIPRVMRVSKRPPPLRADFYVPGDRAMVQDWVRSCETCQRNKTETLRPADVLQPLDVSSQVLADISMDFIEGLPKVGGKSVILTVVDRFSKYAHFIALGHPYTASSVARAFFDGTRVSLVDRL